MADQDMTVFTRLPSLVIDRSSGFCFRVLTHTHTHTHTRTGRLNALLTPAMLFVSVYDAEAAVATPSVRLVNIERR